MRLKNRLTLLGIGLGVAMMALAACGGEPQADRLTQDATVTVREIVNRVEVNSLHPETNELAFVDLKLGQSLQTGNLVKTHENSSARVDISIQNFTRVSRTSPKTIWQLGQFALGGEAVIELQEGKIYVFDEDNGQENWPLYIVTPAGTAAARGTWMAVEYYPETGTVEVECLRGICEMENDLGYQVFTNEQTVFATAVTVPTEPVSMEQPQIEAFKELPEVLSEELLIPAQSTPAEAQVKLEKARTAAVERNAVAVAQNVLEEERKIDSARVSEIINTARSLEENAALGIDKLGAEPDSTEQEISDQRTIEPDTTLNEDGEAREEVADGQPTGPDEGANAQPTGLDEVAGAIDERADAEALATEESITVEARAADAPATAGTQVAPLTLEAAPVSGSNSVPVAFDDTASGLENASSIIINPLANDRDADEDTLTVTNLTQPSNGSVTMIAANSPVEYKPDPGFFGVDTFTYTANDGKDDSNIATIKITILTTTPVAVADIVSTLMDVGVTIDVLQNDTDTDSAKLWVTNLTDPSNGTAEVKVDNTVLYSPISGFIGKDTFTYTANDGKDDSNITTVTVTVAEPGKAVPVAVNDSASGANKISIDVLQNDSDADGDPLTVTNLTQPASGSVTLKANNTVDYTPDPGFFGVDTFTYTANDGKDSSNIATVTVAVNSVPVAIDDTASTLTEVAVTIDVLQNDTDADSASLTVAILTQPSNGTTAMNGDGTVLYSPGLGFTGQDTFTYTANDGTYDSNIATVTVTVSAVAVANTAPVAVDDTASGVENDNKININLLQNDSDPDGDTLTVTSVTQPPNGSVTLKTNFTVDYRPNSGYFGEDTFTYTANDGTDDSNMATVTVMINAIPVAIDDTASTQNGIGVDIDVVQNDTDGNGDTLTVANLVVSPKNGTATVNPDGTVYYMPDPGFIGVDTFTYKVTDGKNTSGPATVSVTVTAAAGAESLTLNVAEGWNSKDDKDLSTEGTLARIQTSDNDWWQLDTSGEVPMYFLSLAFDQSVPADATIISVKVYIEHYEDDGFQSGELTWEVGGGTLSSPSVFQSANPTVLAGPSNEAVVEWDVTSSIYTAATANELKVKITNNSTVGKKNNIDHVYVVVEYMQ